MNVRSTVKAIILNDNKILLNKCLDPNNGSYYCLPGGGQDVMESLSDAVVRECIEETGYWVTAPKFVGVLELICMGKNVEERLKPYMHKLYNIVICRLASESRVEPDSTDEWQVSSDWIPLEELANKRILPKSLNDNIIEMIEVQELKFLGTEYIEHLHA